MRKGFTLIEMLIVIAIIGILASMVLVGLGPVQRQGRDARRISDLRQVQNALELYYNKCGHYPGDSSCGTTPLTDDWAALNTALKGAQLGVNSDIPNDPSSGKVYHYATDLKTYVIGADLEDANNPQLRQSVTSTAIAAPFCQLSANNPYCIQF